MHGSMRLTVSRRCGPGVGRNTSGDSTAERQAKAKGFNSLFMLVDSTPVHACRWHGGFAIHVTSIRSLFFDQTRNKTPLEIRAGVRHVGHLLCCECVIRLVKARLCAAAYIKFLSLIYDECAILLLFGEK